MRNYIILFWLYFASKVFAQTISYPAPAQNISRGLNSSFLTVRIDFSSCINPEVRVALGAVGNIGKIEYEQGSVTKLSGSTSLSISELNISDLTNPRFSISPSPAAGEYIVFRIARRANCDNDPLSKDNVYVTGGCSISEVDPNVNTYSLQQPALTIVAPSLITNASIGSSYNRNIQVTNGGSGCLDSLAFWIKYPSGSTQLNSLSFGSTILTPSFQNTDSAYFEIPASIISSGTFCNGESVTLTENMTVLTCNAITSYGAAWLDHYDSMCSSVNTTAGITMSNNLPVLSASYPVQNFNYCYTNTGVYTQVVRITNTGTGAASNVNLSVRNLIPGQFSSRIYFETVAYTIKNSSGVSIATAIPNVVAMSSVYFRNTACSTVSQTREVSVQIPVLILPGEYIDVEIITRDDNYGCNVTYPDFIGHIALQSQLQYSNQCGSNALQENYKTLVSRSYAAFSATMTAPTDIDGFAPNNIFDLDLIVGRLQTTNNPNNTGLSYLAIPVAGLGIFPNATNVIHSASGANYPMTLSNDTIFIGPIPQGVAISNSIMQIPLRAVCGTGGAKSLSIFLLNKYSSCAPRSKIGTETVNITVHCPDPCPRGGATPRYFSLRRLNIGLPDHNDDGIVSGTFIDSLIRRDRSVHGDTLEAIWRIKVSPNSEPTDPNYNQLFNYVYIDFKLVSSGTTLGNPGSLNALPGVTASVWRGGVNIANLNANMSISGVNAHYEFSAASLPSGKWQNQDSIVVRSLYTVNNYNVANYGNTNAAGKILFVTQAKVYSSYTQKTTPQSTVPLNGENYTCDSRQDYNEMQRISITNYIESGQYIAGCNNLLEVRSKQDLGDYSLPVLFPYEYRNFAILDEVQVTIPAGFTYLPNSAYYISTSNSLSNTDIYQSGNVLTFTNIKKFYTPFGGGRIPEDEATDYRTLYFRIQPTCAASAGISSSSATGSFLGNGLNTSLTHFQTATPSTQASGYTYAPPQPNLSGGGSITSYDGTASWTVVLQNQSNSIGADNSWLYLQNGGLTNIVLRENGIPILPNVNGFYPLSTLVASANRNISISAEVGSCSLDSIVVNYGWGCTGVPSTFIAQSCTQKVILRVQNAPSQIQLFIAKQPKSNLALCSSDTVEFVMNSALAAYADNPKFLVFTPTGLTINQAEIEYPLNSGNWQIVNATTLGLFKVYDLENHSAMNINGLPGTFNAPSSFPRQVKLRLIYSTGCGFVNRSHIMVRQQGMRPCGANISSALGYNASLYTSAITIAGFPPVSGTMSISTTLTPTSSQCGTITLNANLSPILVPTSSTDTVVITIPSGVTYAGGFMSTTGANLAFGYPISLGGGVSQIKIVIPSGIIPGASIDYSFMLNANVLGCGNVDILSQVERVAPPMSCNGVPCTTPSKVLVSSDNATLSLVKPEVQFLPTTHACIETNGTYTMSLPLLMQNTNLALGESMNIEIYCDDGTGNPMGSVLGTYSLNGPISAGTTTMLSFSLTGQPCVPSNQVVAIIAGNSCACSNTMRSIQIYPLPNLTIASSDVCLGQSTSLIVSGADNYIWATGENTASIIVTPSSASSYSVLGTSNISGCSSSAVTTVNVFPLPFVTNTTPTGPYCSNSDTVDLVGSPIGGVFAIDGIVSTSYIPSMWSQGSHLVTYTYTDANGCSNIAPVTIIQNPCILPVNLLSFNAEYLREFQTLLSWTSTQELGFSHYKVERSLDGISFHSVGVVDALGQAMNAYNFVDTDAQIGWNYYRLAMVDIDGSETLSKIAAIWQEEVFTIELYPNPANSILNIVCKSPYTSASQIVSYDALGKEVFRIVLNKEEEHYTIDVSSWSKGLYDFNIMKPNGQVISRKIAIE